MYIKMYLVYCVCFICININVMANKQAGNQAKAFKILNASYAILLNPYANMGARCKLDKVSM